MMLTKNTSTCIGSSRTSAKVSKMIPSATIRGQSRHISQQANWAQAMAPSAAGRKSLRSIHVSRRSAVVVRASAALAEAAPGKTKLGFVGIGIMGLAMVGLPCLHATHHAIGACNTHAAYMQQHPRGMHACNSTHGACKQHPCSRQAGIEGMAPSVVHAVKRA